jgi:adenylate cyclase
MFVLQTTALVGARTLGNFLIGRYYRPVEEDRLFLFLDMKDSTGLARRLGNARFHTLLSDAFFALDSAIVENGGEVITYVGDSVIATWPMGTPGRNSRVAFAVKDGFARLRAERKRFERIYGAVPEFRAVVHGGPVVVGECGDSKRQITYLGDVLNVAARLEEVAKMRHIDFAIAGALIDKIVLPPGFDATSLGAVSLRGVAEPIDVYAVAMR